MLDELLCERLLDDATFSVCVCGVRVVSQHCRQSPVDHLDASTRESVAVIVTETIKLPPSVTDLWSENSEKSSYEGDPMAEQGDCLVAEVRRPQ